MTRLQDFQVDEHFDDIRKALLSMHHYERITNEEFLNRLNANKGREETIKAMIRDSDRSTR